VPLGVELVYLCDLDAQIPDILENGANPLENAILKATAYFKAFRRPLFSCDSGLYIGGLTDEEQPGVHVRTVNGKRLSDDEMIEYYSKIAERLGGRAVAQYRNAICLIKSDDKTYESFADDLWSKPFYIVTKAHKKRKEGFPIDSLSVNIESGQYYYNMAADKSDDLGEGFRRFFKEALQ